jgi:hypothetical protein
MASLLLDLAAMILSRHWISGLFVLPITSLFLAPGCSDGAGD